MRRGALLLTVVIAVCLMFGLSASSAQKSGAASPSQVGGGYGIGPIIGPGIGGIYRTPVHFIGVTTQRFPAGAGALALSHACNEEHPVSRLCEWADIFRAIPPIVLDAEVLVAPNYDTRPVPMCLNPQGGLTCGRSAVMRPAACCGFLLPPPMPSPASITLTPADSQTVNTCADTFEFTATALDAQGAPMAGIVLVFEFPPVVGGTSNPGGFFNPASGVSDGNGQVTTLLALDAGTCTANCMSKDCYAAVQAHDVARVVFSNAVNLVDAIP